MKVKMVQITTNVTRDQYDQLQKQSYKGKKKDKKTNEKTFSEFIREAVAEKLEREGK